MLFIIEQIYLFLSIVVPLLIAVAYFTLFERKLMSAMQRRTGPHIVGQWGLLQPFADALKLLTKQSIVPNKAQRLLFLLAPVYTFAIALLSWIVIPFDNNIVGADISLGVVYLLVISTLSVYGIIIAGWSSNSKYAFLGALRATAQMISYDVSFALIILSLICFVGSANLIHIVNCQEKLWFILPLFPLAFMFFVSSLAETNRTPFDLTEAEAELVAGYNIEYSSVGFTLFFLAEYSNMLLMSIYTVILFLGGWLPIFGLSFISPKIYIAFKTVVIAFLFIWVRATLPRFRYDQLMTLGWKVFLPVALIFFVCVNIYILFIKLNQFAVHGVTFFKIAECASGSEISVVTTPTNYDNVSTLFPDFLSFVIVVLLIILILLYTIFYKRNTTPEQSIVATAIITKAAGMVPIRDVSPVSFPAPAVPLVINNDGNLIPVAMPDLLITPPIAAIENINGFWGSNFMVACTKAYTYFTTVPYSPGKIIKDFLTLPLPFWTNLGIFFVVTGVIGYGSVHYADIMDKQAAENAKADHNMQDRCANLANNRPENIGPKAPGEGYPDMTAAVAKHDLKKYNESLLPEPAAPVLPVIIPEVVQPIPTAPTVGQSLLNYMLKADKPDEKLVATAQVINDPLSKPMAVEVLNVPKLEPLKEPNGPYDELSD